MRKRLSGRNVLVILFALGMLTSTLVAQQQRNRPATQTQPVNSLKVKYKMTAAGQSSETTTMVRGPRQRSEMRLGYGMDMVNITQCDLKRTLQISDKTRKYLVTPMDVTGSTDVGRADVKTTSTPVTRGGVITYVISSIDTGERKEMFGFTARHVKTTMTMSSSPDACSQVNQRIETDGWYIDLSAAATCDFSRAQAMTNPSPTGGCRDHVRFRQEGTGKTGFPLMVTTTMYGPDGRAMFTSTQEVVELSREPLDASLFDVPAGYVETTNSQELYGMPSASDVMAQANSARQPAEETATGTTAGGDAKTPGAIRVGVVQINNKTDKQVSTEALRQSLIGQIQGGQVEAVALNALSRMEAEAEAKAKQCDYILYTDLTAMKSSKLGGMFGRVAGVSGVAKTESKLEFKLFPVGESTPVLQSTAAAKEEGDDASAGAAIAQEARLVSAELRKRGRN
ncbi:MAG: DUF4412 domain-containing protein [Acidobacteriota bacterium]|nr:DUF4412 domain-containing protein [Acidobacteriota bacterium]